MQRTIQQSHGLRSMTMRPGVLTTQTRSSNAAGRYGFVPSRPRKKTLQFVPPVRASAADFGGEEGEEATPVQWSTPIAAGAICAGMLYMAGNGSTAILATAGAAFGASFLLGALLLPLLRALKAQQAIREDGPESHQMKVGTPTMGGLALVNAALAAAYYTGGGATASFVIVATVTCAMGLVGLLDDFLIIFNRKSGGLSAGMKLLAQVFVAAIGCQLTATLLPYPPYDAMPLFGEYAIYVGPLFWLLGGTTIVSESNGVNLTDGLDGLAGSTVAIAFAALAWILARGFPDLVPICAAFAGASVGFLMLNRNPASVFMGNVGSLALGAALGAVIMLSKFFIPGLLVSGVFVLETISVILQVWYYRSTKGPDGKGKRLFLMAPLHHHFELKGWSEQKVVLAFMAIGVASALLGVAQGSTAPVLV